MQAGFAAKFWRALKREDIDTAMEEMKAFLAGIPYVEGFQKKLEEVKNYEGFYEYTFYLMYIAPVYPILTLSPICIIFCLHT